MLELGFHNHIKPENIILVEEKIGVQVQMTWGGGMGGSSKSFYGLIESGDEYEFNFTDLLQNEKIKLSRRYKVFERPRKIIIAIVRNNDDIIERYVFNIGVEENYKLSPSYISGLSNKSYYVGKVRLLDKEDQENSEKKERSE